VLWIVPMEHLKASMDQIKFIDALFDIKPSRILQPLNSRVVSWQKY
jgi:carbonic anhydrase